VGKLPEIASSGLSFHLMGDKMVVSF